VEDSGIEPLTS